MDYWEALCDWYSWESMLGDYIRWTRSYQYRWVGDRIVHPLPIEETERRKRVAEAMLMTLRLRHVLDSNRRYIDGNG